MGMTFHLKTFQPIQCLVMIWRMLSSACAPCPAYSPKPQGEGRSDSEEGTIFPTKRRVMIWLRESVLGTSRQEDRTAESVEEVEDKKCDTKGHRVRHSLQNTRALIADIILHQGEALLGRGAFGQVYKRVWRHAVIGCEDQVEEEVAVKTIEDGASGSSSSKRQPSWDSSITGTLQDYGNHDYWRYGNNDDHLYQVRIYVFIIHAV